MTTEEAINYLKLCADGIDLDFDHAISLAIAAQRAQQEAEMNVPLTPCKLCAYNPPSSIGGKPCFMCPAARKMTEEERT